MALSVLLIDTGSKRSAELVRLLTDLGFDVFGPVSEHDDLYEQLPNLNPDVVVIASDSPRRDTLEHLAGMHSKHPRPMVMLSVEGDSHLTRAAAQAGISAYVVDGLSAPLVRSLVDVTMLAFLSQATLQNELDSSKQSLSEYKTIGKAKAYLMKQLDVSEAVAHRELQRLSQDSRKPLVEVARRILSKRTIS
ncbi:putative Response regulator receiver/ANTAR domain-containing protein [Stutzerimonas xanthomarina]|nr:putative Response regulator receiver/ANTAR domain-containing protein [Stutzerimonas xanthomarina]